MNRRTGFVEVETMSDIARKRRDDDRQQLKDAVNYSQVRPVHCRPASLLLRFVLLRSPPASSWQKFTNYASALREVFVTDTHCRLVYTKVTLLRRSQLSKLPGVTDASSSIVARMLLLMLMILWTRPMFV